VRAAVDRVDDLDDEDLATLLPGEAAASWPPWWNALCQKLEELQRTGKPVITAGHGVENKIIKVNKREGYVELKSDRAQSGKKRRITLRMLENRSATTHGVIIRTLRDLVDGTVDAVPSSPSGWIGPFRIGELFANCLDDKQQWPPPHGGVYLVSENKWKGVPSSGLYVGGISGRSARFCTRVGDLLADMFGFYGGGTGHSSGGQHVHDWCRRKKVNPLNLYLGWYVPVPDDCNRCIERKWHRDIRPELNRYTPPRCEHP